MLQESGGGGGGGGGLATKAWRVRARLDALYQELNAWRNAELRSSGGGHSALLKPLVEQVGYFEFARHAGGGGWASARHAKSRRRVAPCRTATLVAQGVRRCQAGWSLVTPAARERAGRRSRGGG